jgi:hypothetical protein
MLGIWLAACAEPPPALPTDAGARTETIFVVVRGWHADVAIPADALDPRLMPLHAPFPGARYFVFGVGQRNYLLQDKADLFDMAAALLPGPTAVLVTGLREPPAAAFPPPSEVIPLPVTRAGLVRLAAFVANAFEYAPDGAPRLLRPGRYAGSLFYYATPEYSLSYTCNTWAAEALQVTTLPIRASGVLFAGDVARRARRAAERAPAPAARQP